MKADFGEVTSTGDVVFSAASGTEDGTRGFLMELGEDDETGLGVNFILSF